MRHGVRSGRPSVVVHARLRTVPPSRAGFVVSKAVGTAVVRNRVKRRLRHLVAAEFRELQTPIDLVVRALPACVDGDLAGDFDSALGQCLRKLAA